MAVASAIVGGPDCCKRCGEDVDDHTLLFIHNRGEVIDYIVPSFPDPRSQVYPS